MICYNIYDKVTGDYIRNLVTPSYELAMMNYDPDTEIIVTSTRDIPKNHYNIDLGIEEYIPPVIIPESPEEILLRYKARKLVEIRERAYSSFISDSSSYTTQGLSTNIIINARERDLSNAQNLLSLMDEQNLTEIEFRCYDNTTVILSRSDLSTLVSELRLYGLSIYRKKWSLEEAINSATTVEEVEAINW